MKKWEDDDNDSIYLLTQEEIDYLPTDTVVDVVDGYKIQIKDIKSHDLRHTLEEIGTGIKYTMFGVRDPWNHPCKELFMWFLLKS